jgi:enoyl-CoA hydratase/carnithine racemase
MDEEAQGQLECFGSPDFAEAIAAFVEKRAPNYG